MGILSVSLRLDDRLYANIKDVSRYRRANSSFKGSFTTKVDNINPSKFFKNLKSNEYGWLNAPHTFGGVCMGSSKPCRIV